MNVPRTAVTLIFIFCYSDAYSCTIFTISQEDSAFFTGNDDYITTDSIMWVDPPEKDIYGVLFFGDPNNIQQGFNEVGLVYDSNGLPSKPVIFHSGMAPSPDNYTHYSMAILRECRNVEEVMLWVNMHRWPGSMHDQMHFADSEGNAVVISTGTDGTLAFTEKKQGNSFLVSTNFNLADISNGTHPCKRFETADRMLSELLLAGELNSESAARVAESVSVKSPFGRTLYTHSTDLKNSRLYLYYMFQYRDPVIIDIKNVIAQSGKPKTVSSLFPENVRRNAKNDLGRVQRRPLVLSFVGLTGIALSLLLLKKSGKRKQILPVILCVFSILATVTGIASGIIALIINSSVENPALPADSCSAAKIEKDGEIIVALKSAGRNYLSDYENSVWIDVKSVWR